MRYFIVLAFLFTSIAFATRPNWQDKRPVLTAPILLDGQTLGDIWVNPQDPEGLIIDRTQFLYLMRDILTPEKYQVIQRYQSSANFLYTHDLERLYGLSFSFDLNALVVNLKIPNTHRKPNKIDLTNTKRPLLHHFTPKGLSGFFNVHHNLTYREDTSSINFLDLELVGNLNNFSLINRADYQSGSSTNFSRTSTTLVKDIPGRLTRLEIGDITPQNQGFQDGSDGVGFGLKKTNEFRNYAINSSINNFELELQGPTTITVFINGIKYHQEFFPGGKVTLENFPFILGQNNIEVKIEEQNGKITYKRLNNFFHPELFRPGYSEYSLYLKKNSTINSISGELEYNGDDELLAYYEEGISDKFTLSGNTLISNDGALLGGGSKFIALKSYLEFDLGFSQFNSQKGAKLQLSQQLLNRITKIDYRMRNILSYSTRSFLFDRQTAPLRYSLLSSIGVPVYKRITTNLTLGRKDFYNADNEWNSGLDVAWRFARNWNGTVTLNKVFGGINEFRTSFTINWIDFENQNRVYSRYTNSQSDNIADSSRINLRAEKNMLYGTHQVRTSAEVTKTKTNDQGEINLNYIGPKVESRLAHNHSDNLGHSGSIVNRFSVAFAGNNFSVGRPIGNSFAIIKLKNKVDTPVELGRGATSSYGDLNTFGGALVPTLAPYYNHTLSINTLSLPYGVSLPFESFSVLNNFKSGTFIEIDNTVFTSVIISIENKSRRKIKYKKTLLLDAKNNIIATGFVGRGNQVFFENIKPGKYKLKVEGVTDTPILQINDDETGLIRINTELNEREND